MELLKSPLTIEEVKAHLLKGIKTRLLDGITEKLIY
jgi:hypothetical protein